MPELDRLVQRFVDQELAPEERVTLLARLGRDETLRRRALALETVVLEAMRLPRPVVPDGFVEGVLARAGRPSAFRRVLGALVAPRTARWNLLGALATAGVLALVVAGMQMGGADEGRDDSPPVLVRLVLVQPEARTVQAAGDFNGWNPASTPLEPLSNGAWAVTIPLEPGRYEYMFVVDGDQWIADPLAVERSDDGFGAENAVLDVRLPVGTT